MPFIVGPAVNPFARASQDPVDLLQSLTPAQKAAAVPIVKIVKLDSRTGHPDDSVRPLMFDLIAGPQFGGAGFGIDQNKFLERSAVSLLSCKIATNMQYGFMAFRQVDLEFKVHRPDLVFDRLSQLPWHALLEAGTSFSLEYGWVADRAVCPNPLFNGDGFFDERSGLVVKSTEVVLLVLHKYNIHLEANGEVTVTMTALENGDIALRESRFSDAIDEAVFPDPRDLLNRATAPARKTDDVDNAQRLRSLIDGLDVYVAKGRGKLYRMQAVLDGVVAPLVESACKLFGYAEVKLYLGNFNKKANRQADAYGGEPMAGRPIGDFKVPVERLKERLALHAARGRSILLHNVINMVVDTVNEAAGWAPDPVPSVDEDGISFVTKPNIAMQSKTLYDHTNGRASLVMQILDRNEGADVLNSPQRISVKEQTRDEVFRRLKQANVPIIEFGRGNSYIEDASFELQQDALFQAILIDSAYRDVKDRQEQSQTPDVESRRGHQGAHDEIIPVSIVQGELVMVGNFVFETFAQYWIEFFGANAISGLFHALEKTDELVPGGFRTTVKMISEGSDPFNTRRRLSDKELQDIQARRAALQKKK